MGMRGFLNVVPWSSFSTLVRALRTLGWEQVFFPWRLLHNLLKLCHFPEDCNNGRWNGSQCECKSGYTGQLCDSILYSFPIGNDPSEPAALPVRLDT